MNLVVKYAITGAANAAQLPNDGTALGITGVNFVGASCGINMALANPVAANASDLATILPSTNNINKGTYVDKVIAITLPNLGGTTVNYASVTLDKIGINTDIIGVETLGLNRVETANQAAFAKHFILEANLGFSVSKNRLIITIGAAVNAIGGSILNIRVTYKN